MKIESKYNTYSPDDCGFKMRYGSSDFLGGAMKDKSGETIGISSYDRVGHGFWWYVPYPDEYAQGYVTIEGDRIIPVWSHKENTRMLETPLDNSKVLFSFLNMFKGVTDFKGLVAQDEIIEFSQKYGLLVAQPKSDESTTNYDNFIGGNYEEDSVNRFIEHWKFCSEIYELHQSKKDPKRMRLILNLLMKEISVGIYAKGLFGEAPELDVKALDGGLRILKESDETVTGYRIPSLRAVITIHLFDVVTGSLNTSVCDECGERYVSQKKRRENQKKYCSKKCKNKSTVRDYRARRRNLDVKK